MKDVRLTVRFPVELRQRLKAVALRTGTPESELVREAVERNLEARSGPATAYDGAMAAGLVGVVSTGVGDLSTNRAHFEGFGGTPRK